MPGGRGSQLLKAREFYASVLYETGIATICENSQTIASTEISQALSLKAKYIVALVYYLLRLASPYIVTDKINTYNVN